MALAARTHAAPRPTGTEDGIVVLDGFTWADYERLLEIRGDRSAPRIRLLRVLRSCRARPVRRSQETRSVKHGGPEGRGEHGDAPLLTRRKRRHGLRVSVSPPCQKRGPSAVSETSDSPCCILRVSTWSGASEAVAPQRTTQEPEEPRISYLEGRVEIKSPSRGHANIKSLIGRLVEVWCLERGIAFTTLGAWTQKEEALERGVEPDECYAIGENPGQRRPDLAIEVIWTHGGLDKLEIYRKLGVGEVWIWEDDVLTPYVLRGDRYVEIEKSGVFPDMDLGQLASFLDRPTTSRAILDYRAALRGGGS